LPKLDGVIVVTTPSVSQDVVKKAVRFAKKLEVPVIGIIENVSGFLCPKCGTETYIFRAGGGEKIAGGMGLPFLRRIPIDPEICQDTDAGVPFILEHENSPAAKAFMNIVKRIEDYL